MTEDRFVAIERIDELTLRSDPARLYREIVIQRTVKRLQRQLDAAERVAPWLAIARARQGSE